MSEAGTHELDQAAFERMIAVLDGEQQDMRPSGIQRFSYWLYTAFVWGLVLSVLLGICFAAATKEGHPGVADDALLACSFAVAICFLGGVVSLLLNLPLVYKIVHQRIIIGRLGFSGASSLLWRAHQKTRRAGVYIGRISLGMGILLLLIGVVMFSLRESIVGWVAFLFGTLLVMFFVLTTGKAWLDMMSNRWTEVTQLKQSMEHLRSQTSPTSDGRIAVSGEAIKQFAYIENEQIARSRVRAAAESVSAPKSEFSVLSSRAVLRKKADLEPGERLKVEETLAALMLQPKPPGVQVDPSGSLVCGVVGTGLSVVYKVNDADRQIRVMSLQTAGSEAATSA